MTNTGGFEVMLQFTQEIVNDIFVRVLNESLVTNLHLKSPISRLIDEPLPPTQVKAWWDKPELELDADDSISLSVDVTGGARQLLTQRNLEVDGSVSITRKALLATDDMGELYIHLEAPKLLDLHMSKLKVTYPGSTWPPLLSAIDPTRETTILRPLLTKTLMEPLSQLPLSYKVKSLPLHFPVSDTSTSRTPTIMSSEWHIPVTTASVSVLKTKQADAVAMGLSLTYNRCDPTQMTIAFPKEAKSNAALTLTSMGMNNIIGQLRRRGALKGIIPSSSSGGAPVNWQWEVLSVHCHEGYISLTGNFRRNATFTRVTADLKCSLDRDGALVIILRSTNTDTLTAKTVVDSWSKVLRMILRARAKDQQDDKNKDWHKLFQCFAIAGTQIEVETPADDILIEEGTFTVLYHVPQTMGFQAEIPWLKPQVVVIEPHIPVQTARGAPVSMRMQAQITTQSFPPYDYVWTKDLSEEPTPDRGPSMTVTGYPTAVGTGPQVYTHVRVKVIDAFGQTAEAKAPAMYQPWEQQQVSAKVSYSGSGRGGSGGVGGGGQEDGGEGRGGRQEGSESQSDRFNAGKVLSSPPPYRPLVLPPQPRHSLRGHWRSAGCLLLLAVIIIIGYAFWQGAIQAGSPPNGSSLPQVGNNQSNPSGNNQSNPSGNNQSTTPIPGPIVGITPTSGPAAGGTSVTITGSGFTGATSVSFGATAASGFTVESDTQITATSPAGSSGTVDVTVTTAGGTSATSSNDQFTYIPLPVVSSISPPARGSIAGGTSVTITGSGFTGATGVSFGATAATTFTVDSDTQITATSPRGSNPVPVDVTVTTAGGTSATSPNDQFTYTAIY